jgi:hypothetical protein
MLRTQLSEVTTAKACIASRLPHFYNTLPLDFGALVCRSLAPDLAITDSLPD